MQVLKGHREKVLASLTQLKEMSKIYVYNRSPKQGFVMHGMCFATCVCFVTFVSPHLLRSTTNLLKDSIRNSPEIQRFLYINPFMYFLPNF